MPLVMAIYAQTLLQEALSSAWVLSRAETTDTKFRVGAHCEGGRMLQGKWNLDHLCMCKRVCGVFVCICIHASMWRPSVDFGPLPGSLST